MSDAPQVDETVGEVTLDGPVRSLPIRRTNERFEVRLDDEAAVLEYRLRGTVLSVTHTEVPEALRGQGIGEALARVALDDARARGMTVKPYCPFVARYIESHPEYCDLVDPGFPIGVRAEGS